MRKFINDVGLVEEQVTQGAAKAHPQYLRKLGCGNTVMCAHKKEGRIALINGGSSGHEPAHDGLVGTEILDGAVTRMMLTSPTPGQIYGGTKAVATDAGVLMVIKSYTGDVMNFGMAAEMAKMEGITVKHVVTNDDVTVKGSLCTIECRGVTRTIFIYRVAGALAETGGTLGEVWAATQRVIGNVRAMGTTTGPCITPAASKPESELAEGEMGVGIGVHGESGTHREMMKTADETVDLLLARALADLGYAGSEVVVMTNGVEATPFMELLIINNRIADILAEKGIKVYRTIVGKCMTSTEMQDFSISFLRLDNELKELLDALAGTPVWR